MSEGMTWVTSTPPGGRTPAGIDAAGLRAAIDGDGAIWAWCGLLQERYVALMLAASDGEPVLFDDGNEYLRLDWMRSNLVTDEAGNKLVLSVEKQVRRMAYQ